MTQESPSIATTATPVSELFAALGLLACLCLACLCTAAESAAADAAAQPPNILLILVDDLGYGDLAGQGATDMRTPQLDELMADSLRFSSFYANCPVCSPTRAAVLTGCFPDRVGVPGVIRTMPGNNWGYFSPPLPTLPERLSELGYETAAVGKWHLGLRPENHPHQRGFDQFRGFLGDMMDDYYNHRRHGNNYMRNGTETVDPEGHATDLFTSWAEQFIRSRDRGGDADPDNSKSPWFLYLAYNAPHTPIQPPEDWLSKVRARQPEMSDKRAKLVALIEHLDDGIGRVLAALDESNQADETIVVFTSDNGGQLSVGANNGPLRNGKGSMYEGGLRVPASIRVPGMTTPGSSTPAVASTVDLLPTLVELAGGDPPTDVDGQTLMPLIDSVDAPWTQREIYFVRREGGIQYAGLTIEALRYGDHKLLHNFPTSKFELYNVRVDPAETKELSQSQPQVFRQMISRLQRHTQRGGQVPWQKPGA